MTQKRIGRGVAGNFMNDIVEQNAGKPRYRTSRRSELGRSRITIANYTNRATAHLAAYFLNFRIDGDIFPRDSCA